MKQEFLIAIEGIDVRVTYEAGWLNSGYDHFQFFDRNEPRKPIPISPTGYRSQFAHHELVERCGGPEAYAKAYAAAQLRDDGLIWIQEGEEAQADQTRQLSLFS